MKFRRIFSKQGSRKFRAVCYPGDCSKGRRADIFSKLFNCWNDTMYLQQCLVENQSLLTTSGGKNMSVDEAIDQILDEANLFERHLRQIENREPGYENLNLQDMFRPLNEDVHVWQASNIIPDNHFPGWLVPRLQIYAIVLEDYFIVTGGAICSDGPMVLTSTEKGKIDRVRSYFKKSLVAVVPATDEH